MLYEYMSGVPLFETHVAAHHDRALFDFAPLGLYMIGARHSVRDANQTGSHKPVAA
jgi:hypothetical protein